MNTRIFIFILISITCTACDEILTAANEGNTVVSGQEHIVTDAPSLTEEDAPNARADFEAEDLNYKGRKVVLTRHGKCRMGCRELDAFEVQEVINQDNINEGKTRRDDPRGPSIAYEGVTSDGQHARVIVGDSDPAKIITVIDLDNKYDCHCD